MVIQFPFLVCVIPAAVAAVILVVGLGLFLRVHEAAGAVVLLFGVVVAAVFGPMLFTDRVVVDDTRIEQRTGFWFAPTVKGFDFAEAERVVITQGRDLRGRAIEMWIAEYRSRPSVRVDPGDLWEMNGKLLAEELTERGARVVRSDD